MSGILAMKPVIRDSRYLQLISKANWKLALSSSDVQTLIWFLLGFTSPDLTLLPLSSICSS